MNRTGVAIGLAVVAVVAGSAWMLRPGAQAQGLLPYRDADAVAQGAQIYGDYCASCHGDRLQGQVNWRERDAEGYLPAPPHDQTGHTWHHPDGQLVAITTLGTERLVGDGYKSRMAGFGDILDEDEILAVLAYIKSTWPPAIVERHNAMNDQAGG